MKCDCVGGWVLAPEYSEEVLAEAIPDDSGNWWIRCCDCQGTGQMADEREVVL